MARATCMSSTSNCKVDCHAAFRHVEKRVEAAVRDGSLRKEEARRVLDKARESYRNENYNRAMDMIEERKNAR